jgi:PIN domain nuclease of toxin-antitoxin system
MRLLLDTHVALWAIIDPEKLSQATIDTIASSDNDIFVSAASIWEIAIKHALQRAGAPPFSGQSAIRIFGEAGYSLVAITPLHSASTEAMPLLHHDPFDRLIVAQSQAERMILMTRDAEVAAYDGSILLV